jgi:CBS domain-containing protein
MIAVMRRRIDHERGREDSSQVMRRVADAMTAPPVVLEPSITIQEASAKMLDGGVHAAVIVDDGRVCGLTTAQGISTALAEGYDVTATLLGVIAERDVPVARPDEPLADAHERMRAERHPVVAVVGSKGEPVGVLEDHEARD